MQKKFDFTKIFKVLKKWIELEPNSGAEKFMSLGQISDYKIAQQCYEKGIQIFTNDLNSSPDNQQIKSSLASAYSALAELYMNSDLW